VKKASFHAVLLVALWLLPALAHAGLKWDSTLVRAEAVAGQDRVTAEFPFQNGGTADVAVASLRPTCDCTTAALAQNKARYAPGERGAVEVTFTVGDRTGYQRKTVEVWEQGAKAPTVLTLAVHLSEPLKVTPNELKWRKGDTSAKTVEVSALQGVKIEQVETTAKGFAVQTKESASGIWTISVQPQAEEKPFPALLRVHFSGNAAGVISVPLSVE